MKKLFFAIFSLSLILLSGCGAGENESGEKVKVANAQDKAKIEAEEKQKQNEELVKEAVNKNLEYAESEQLDLYLATMSKEIRENPEVVQSTQDLFNNFDIDYEMISFNVVDLTDDKATVEMKQKAVATAVADGFSFQNHIATAKHTLVKEDGKFVFENTEIIGDVEKLQ